MAIECYWDSCDHHEKTEPFCDLEKCTGPTFVHVVNGDVTSAPQRVIAHQVNCMRTMGSGVAVAMRKIFPEHYDDYMNDSRKPEEKFGTCIRTYIETKHIVGLYGQFRYGRTGQFTDYKALKNAFEELCIHITKKHKVFEVAMPFGIGAGLGGGNWDIILSHLSDVANKYKVHIYFYKLR